MYEALIAHLRECAKLDPSNNTFKEAAEALEEMNAYAIFWHKIAEYNIRDAKKIVENYKKEDAMLKELALLCGFSGERKK